MGDFYRKKLTQNLKEKTAQGRGQELCRINLRITQGLVTSQLNFGISMDRVPVCDSYFPSFRVGDSHTTSVSQLHVWCVQGT